jgi:ketosteroid isomerase-like protein
MSRDAEILFANEAFYLAFANRDVDAMDALWAHEAPVTCVHPGWEALRGRDEVMESWGNILNHPSAPHVHCRDARVVVYGSVAQVLCFEVLEAGVLMAANLFVHESGSWRLVHHQASPLAEAPSFEDSEPEAPRLQ